MASITCFSKSLTCYNVCFAAFVKGQINTQSHKLTRTLMSHQKKVTSSKNRIA